MKGESAHRLAKLATPTRCGQVLPPIYLIYGIHLCFAIILALPPHLRSVTPAQFAFRIGPGLSQAVWRLLVPKLSSFVPLATLQYYTKFGKGVQVRLPTWLQDLGGEHPTAPPPWRWQFRLYSTLTRFIANSGSWKTLASAELELERTEP